MWSSGIRRWARSPPGLGSAYRGRLNLKASDQRTTLRPESTRFVFKNSSGARDLNPGPHGPEPAPSRVLQYPRGSSGVLLYLIGAMVVTVLVLSCPPGSGIAVVTSA